MKIARGDELRTISEQTLHVAHESCSARHRMKTFITTDLIFRTLDDTSIRPMAISYGQPHDCINVLDRKLICAPNVTFTNVSRKFASKMTPLRLSQKYVPQMCPEHVPQKCAPMRPQMCCKYVPQKCAPEMYLKNVPQKCAPKMCSKKVPQKGGPKI